MIEAPIRKIQILTDKQSGTPIFYCHSADIDHHPVLSLERVDDKVIIRARQMLYKVKMNPQRKNRVDIYMSLSEARYLGTKLIEVSASPKPIRWKASKANPYAAATGSMKLPGIIWSLSNKYIRSGARTNSGILMNARDGYINIDLEFPHQTHIKMKEHEIHIGITITAPSGTHDPSKTFQVDVPDHELQRGRNEQNPISKVYGDFYVELQADVASGLGLLLQDIEEPQGSEASQSDVL